MRVVGLVVGAILVAGVAVFAVQYVTTTSTAQPVPFSEFLSDVGAGRVESVTQDGEVVTYRRAGTDVRTIVPSVLTDVNAEIAEAAVTGGVSAPTFSKNVTPEVSSLELFLVGILPVALVVLAVVALWFAIGRRGSRDPLRILDDAWRAGLLTPEEYATKRERLRGRP